MMNWSHQITLTPTAARALAVAAVVGQVADLVVGHLQEAAHRHQLVVTGMDIEGEVILQKGVRQVALFLGVLEVEAVYHHRAKSILHHQGALKVWVAIHHIVMVIDLEQAAIVV